MRLCDYLDKGASLGPSSPCLTTRAKTMSYADVQAFSYTFARALERAGVKAGEKVAILSSNDPTSVACVFGISRAGAVWCPINPRNEANENREVLDLFDCVALFYQSAYEQLVLSIKDQLPKLRVLVCLDRAGGAGKLYSEFAAGLSSEPLEIAPIDELVMLVGTGGTTGRPKGVMLTARNIETFSALTLMGYPFESRPNYLAFTSLTHAAGVLCFPVMTHGGQIVIMPKPDVGEFLKLVGEYSITHAFLPPTVIYMMLSHDGLAAADFSSMQCFWYGAAPMSASKLEEALERITPAMGQLFGQSEAPMMLSMLSPADHFHGDGTIAKERLASAGKAAPLVTLAIMDEAGKLLPTGERGEIVCRSSLVMAGYYKNPEATAEAGRFGWHHTGDIGYLDEHGYLFIVDRAKDMIITGAFNVYSAEVEQAIMQHSAVQDCAVVGLPDEKWGERVTAVIQLRAGQSLDADDLKAFVKGLVGAVKSPKQVEIWPDLPRSKLGKVLKKEIRAQLLEVSSKAG